MPVFDVTVPLKVVRKNFVSRFVVAMFLIISVKMCLLDFSLDCWQKRWEEMLQRDSDFATNFWRA